MIRIILSVLAISCVGCSEFIDYMGKNSYEHWQDEFRGDCTFRIGRYAPEVMSGHGQPHNCNGCSSPGLSNKVEVDYTAFHDSTWVRMLFMKDTEGRYRLAGCYSKGYSNSYQDEWVPYPFLR